MKKVLHRKTLKIKHPKIKVPVMLIRVSVQECKLVWAYSIGNFNPVWNVFYKENLVDDFKGER